MSARAPALLSSEERGLSLLTFRARQELARGAPLPRDVGMAARGVLEEMPFEHAAGRFDMFEPETRRLLPPRVVEAWRFYAGVVEAHGFGDVRVLDVSLSAAHDDIYLVHAVTYAGEGYLEVYGASGEPLLSGLTEEGRLSSWDERFSGIRAVARSLSTP